MLQLLGTDIQTVAAKGDVVCLSKLHHPLLHLADVKRLDGRVALPLNVCKDYRNESLY